ncbi:WXG100 family type VII secretion target [Motilibacter deserti]|uniref:Excreted virulence factor EspC (Type VII ESX diderm) n=1 Tax=Motilibacter deserti TaxID=2714956 RepID=A0ABX0GUF4_9ACTN|nr:type VII secretion target [Motilibacter deserti]NHC14533.1 hypothetical protein [Motilibacter deserti]
MGCDLKVDTDELRDLASRLRGIRTGLESASDDMTVLHGELGSGVLATTMDRFASEWRVRRRKLCASVEAVEQMAAQSARQYDACDDALARAVAGGRK